MLEVDRRSWLMTDDQLTIGDSLTYLAHIPCCRRENRDAAPLDMSCMSTEA
jgi:hypothetical protein